jgi:hypothetical protein
MQIPIPSKKKSFFSKTFKNGIDDDDVDKHIPVRIVVLLFYFFLFTCGIFTSKPPATPTLYIPPPFHLWTIKYLDQNVKIENVFLCVSPPLSFFFLSV